MGNARGGIVQGGLCISRHLPYLTFTLMPAVDETRQTVGTQRTAIPSFLLMAVA